MKIKGLSWKNTATPSCLSINRPHISTGVSASAAASESPRGFVMMFSGPNLVVGGGWVDQTTSCCGMPAFLFPAI